MLPRYRLPTEVEWEFASLGLIGNLIPGSELRKDSRIYPWSGHTLRNFEEKVRGNFMANFVRGQGDYAGVAGYLNDNAFITAPVKSYWPNDYGLYNMSGNVSEWVYDVYRTLSSDDKNEFNSYRGNIYKTAQKDADGNIAEKDSLGKISYIEDTANYPKGPDVRGFADKTVDETNGSRVSYYNPNVDKIGTRNYSTLVNDVTRVFKGGSWKDRAYYMTAGSRRKLDQKESTSAIGFRCAMIRVGSPNGMGESGNSQE
jgi:formylglycine-generating enzyme required for sulfatase activity